MTDGSVPSYNKSHSIICYRLAQERRSRSVHRCTAKGAQKCGRPFCLLHHVPWKIYYVNQILYGPHRIISIKILRICNITWYRQYGNSAHRKGGLHQCLQLSCHREIGTFSAYLIHPYFLPNREHIPPPSRSCSWRPRTCSGMRKLQTISFLPAYSTNQLIEPTAEKGGFLVRGSFNHRLSLLLNSSKDMLAISYQALGLATLLNTIGATLGCTTGGGTSASTSSGTEGVTGGVILLSSTLKFFKTFKVLE